MPPLQAAFAVHVSEAEALAAAGESARLKLEKTTGSAAPLVVGRLERLYEVAYLRVFVQWEAFLEATFFRYLCGFSGPTHGVLAPVAGVSFQKSLAGAEALVLGPADYVLWHNPNKVVQRSKKYFVQGPHETVTASNSSRLDALAAVRHRIVHEQSDAKTKFDQASMLLASKRYAASKPGRLLRDWDVSAVPPRRYLHSFAAELTRLAMQIV